MTSRAPSAEAYNAKILSTLEQIQRDVADIKGRIGGAPVPGKVSGGRDREIEPASDSDLDGSHGNPLIKYDPKDTYWTGESYAGCHFSETPPEYLDAMARYLAACAHMAQKDFDKTGDKKYEKSAHFKGLDARRAAGWARRKRNGWQAPTEQASQPAQRSASGGAAGYDQNTGEEYGGDDSDVPFVSLVSGIWRA